MKVAFYTLGCKLNQAETESLASRFGEAGFQLVSADDGADIYIANTCTVTHVADRKSRHWLRLARRRNPRALIIATGCYAQRDRQELVPLADLIVDNKEKGNLLALIQTLRGRDESETKQSRMLAAAVRTRSLMKIQDGCHSSCAYCIVPKVRPNEYSLPASLIIDEVKQKVALGYKEAVLTGTKVGSYKDDGTNLGALVKRILTSTSIERLRLSSLQPSEISPELLALCQDERLCRHFHLALQSGSESVLQRMKRSYSLYQYQRTVDLIRKIIQKVAITTDVMVGFPGESDEEFEQSYLFCLQAGFANIHVFPFSPRPDTAAAAMTGQVADKVKQERNQRMLELAQSSRRRFSEQFLGQTMPVLWEKETEPGSGTYSGLTSNYIRIFARSHKDLSNEITPARLLGLHTHGIWAEVHDGNSS
ncbi:MAG: tRNA (N(6)-L-threonylcarbamoyladenosine(37)-C(2))-methylthiotransferase MtaB [Dehalococcoidia bacterium]